MSYRNIPQDVRSCLFCTWKYVRKKGQEKPTKVPYDPRTGFRASTRDPGTFTGFDTAMARYEKGGYDGIGILVKGSVAAFDIDGCIDADGNLSPLAASVLGEFKNCYVEVSPSGTGLRGFFKTADGFIYDKEKYYIKRGGLEIYVPGVTNRFVTVTGNVYRDGTACDETEALGHVLEAHMVRRGVVASLPEDFEPHSFLTDDEALAKAMKNKKFADCYRGGWESLFDSQSEADMSALSILAFYCGGDMEQMARIFEGSSLMRSKFADSRGLTEYAVNTMKKAVAICGCFYDPGHYKGSAFDDFEELEDEEQGDGVHENDGMRRDHTTSDRKEALEALIASSPDAETLYLPQNMLLAAYAYENDPGSYEKLRTIAKTNGMAIRRYEKAVRDRAKEVNEAAVEADAAKMAKEIPDFVAYSASQKQFYIDCAKLAIHVKENLPFILVQNSLTDTRMKYVYEGGVYVPCSDERFKGFIKKFIEDFDPALVKMRDVSEVCANLSSGLEAVGFEELNSNEGIINFRNGILNIDTMELKEHDPSVLSSIKIPCDWKGDDGAECQTPVFDAYLDKLTDGDKATQRLLLEFMGVAISNVRGSRYKKALFMYGPGDTGKSQLKVLTEKLLGSRNYVGIDLPELEARFGTSMIYGKRLAGSADMTFLTVRELKKFKNCTGGDSVFTEFKGHDGFSFIYGGLLWFCMNQLPRFGGDDGTWVYSRILPVECRNVIAAEDQDKKLADRMYEERDGIVYRAVMAMKETVDNGYFFSEPGYMDRARDSYRAENNSAIAFIEECMEPRESAGEIANNDSWTVKAVYDVYRNWCRDNNSGFAKQMKAFKATYADWFGVSPEDAVVRRGRGMYFVSHKLTEDAVLNYRSPFSFTGIDAYDDGKGVLMD